MRKYDPKTVTRAEVARDIGAIPGQLGGSGLSPRARSALKYYCRKWLGMSRDEVQGELAPMRRAYDCDANIAAYQQSAHKPAHAFVHTFVSADANPDATIPAKAVRPTGTTGEELTEDQDTGAAIPAEAVEALVEGRVEDTPVIETTPDDAAKLAALIRSLSAGAMDADAVAKIVRAEVAKLAETIRPGVATVEVRLPDGKTRNVGRQHKQFPTLLKMLSAGVNVWLAGPAGSGKTTAAEAVAAALGRPFFFNGAIDNEYKLLGFTDAQGRVVSRPFREAFCNGGVYLFDEVDASLPSAVLAFNAALANGKCDFPDGCHDRHPDFVAIAAGNTWGNGATSDYVGRFKMDAAFADRFVMLAWEYDEALERELAGNDEWTSRVQTIRAKVAAKGLKVVVSPRASIYGARLLAAGLDRETVEAATVRKGMTDEQWQSVAA